MWRKMETKINRTNITQHLIEYELKMAGKTLIDAVDDDRWYFNFTLTHKQFAEFREYSIPLLKKVFKFNSAKANDTFGWFYKNFGLRISK